MYYNRKNIRLQGYDYATSNAYFVTICTKNRENLFWVKRQCYELNNYGKIVLSNWLKMEDKYDNILLDEFVYKDRYD
jgi:hypothetical protein